MRFLMRLLSLVPNLFWFNQTPQENCNSIDLRFCRRMQMSESWDGVTTCSDGWTWHIILYKDRVVWRQSVLKVGGSTEIRRPRTTEGFWPKMCGLTQAYQHVGKIGYHKRFDPPGQEDKKDWDVVCLSPDVHTALINHPTFLTCLPGTILTPIAERADYYRVEVETSVEVP